MKREKMRIPPPGGRRARTKKGMKKSAPRGTIKASQTSNKEADVKKCTTKRCDIDYELRKKIEK